MAKETKTIGEETKTGLEKRLVNIQKEWKEDIVISLFIGSEGEITIRSCFSAKDLIGFEEGEEEEGNNVNLENSKIVSPFKVNRENYFG